MSPCHPVRGVLPEGAQPGGTSRLLRLRSGALQRSSRLGGPGVPGTPVLFATRPALQTSLGYASAECDGSPPLSFGPAYAGGTGEVSLAREAAV